ncbi:MAG: alpha-glucan family phosphorylase [Chthoniobacterales bacterium]|nr:alpha-glucan family phosphorylase [Chthoniobacterales bacterium]
MEPILTYNVLPKLPAALEPLREMVYNLWWTWEPEARRLFRFLDVPLWDATNHNPLRMLQTCRQARLTEVAGDEHFLKDLHSVHARFRAYMERQDTYGKLRSQTTPLKNPVAYFSAEYGFHESFPNYSGGLGILSGDHCKSASDLDLNFVAVGLLYRDGYFKQQIDKEGWQEAVRLNQNFHHLPVEEVRHDGVPLKIAVSFPNREVHAKVWRLAVGRIPLYLLDTMLPENSPEDQLITAQLYGGDQEFRIRQEIVLGMGGCRALRAMGIFPQVFHMNEGHSAFLVLERIREYVRTEGLDFSAALQVVAASGVFTTHTPVPAGNDAFSHALMEKYFTEFPQQVGITFDRLFGMGQATVDPENTFSMTILALRASRYANGVSKLHGEVSRGLWKNVWKDVPVDEVPITSITNGVHIKTWAAGEFHDLYEKYLGKDWEDQLTCSDYWRGVIDIPDEVLWNLHQLLKQRTIDFLRERIHAQRLRNGEPPDQVRHANRLLNSEVLTVGFARRFATYKRGTLLFRDLDRLVKLITNRERPVQFVFAGKSHPADDGGKKLIQEVYQHSRDPRFEDRIVFVEDYDTNVARRLCQGVDLWLNNPLRPLEASGTSGMKFPPNGGLNFSVLDGWWLESWNGKNGWAIGSEITGGSEALQDQVDLQSLFHVLENQIIPLYYAKPDGRLPLAWIQLMRESLRTVVPVFNTHRMVSEYNERLYEPSASAVATLSENHCANAVALSEWKAEIRAQWPQVRVLDYELAYQISDDKTAREVFFVGEQMTVEARVHLGAVKPGNVRVQAYYGPVDKNRITTASFTDLQMKKSLKEGNYLFSGLIPASESGSYGLNVRVIPTHPHITQAHELRLITWAR